jgi:hypothetical protein
MNLLDAIRLISSFDERSTVYAASPWTRDSAAVVDLEPEEGGLPTSAQDRGMTYFLEVASIREFFHGWEAALGRVPTLEEQCTRLIQFATCDA